jgi:hypothetical protein
MNSDLIRELTSTNAVNTPGRIAGMAPNDESCVETTFLVALTRRPTIEEQEHFVKQLTAKKPKKASPEGLSKAEQDRPLQPEDLRSLNAQERAAVVEDLFWSLCNSPEFSWNH